MAFSCPANLDVAKLRAEVARIYRRVADDPDGEFHFHRGPTYAAERLGYDASELASLPTDSTRSFAGVANPLAIEPLEPGETVVDIGSGAGMDLLLAARRVGPGGRVIGIDLTDAMLARARASAAAAGATHVELRKGDMQAIPLDDGVADTVISNGVLNLAPDKQTAFAEIARIVRPGGRLLLGDIVIDYELSEDARSNIDLWAA